MTEFLWIWLIIDSNITCDDDSDTICDDDSNTTCDKDSFGAEGTTVKKDGGTEADIILSSPGYRC